MITLIRNIVTRMVTMPRGIAPATGRMHLVTQVASPLGAIIHVTWAVLFWYLDLDVLSLWNFLSAIAFTLMAFYCYDPRYLRLFIFIALMEIPAHAFLATWYLGIAPLFLIYAITPVVLSMSIAFWSRLQRAVLGALFVVLFSAMMGYFTYFGPVSPLSAGWNAYFAVTNTLFGVGQLVLAYAVFDHAVIRTERALKREHDRAEGLLKNILPDPIALRLKDGEHLIADDHPEVSVIFADIVNFTEASAKLRPAELVETLNLVFTEFDLLAERHGAEKIKTIGDAYMAVIGVPDDRANHAVVAVDLALDMLRTAREVSAKTHFPIDLRIGINSGPVVAGVIGKNKFAYDLWGDAVNVAARMESHSEPGMIMLTSETRALLGDAVSTRDEGQQDIKGKGLTRVWSLVLPTREQASHT